MPPEQTRPTGPLRPIELATAAVMAALATALTVAGWFLPHLGVVASFAIVPLGVVAHRHRLRALLASMFSASVLSFLVAGTGSVSNLVGCAAVGGLIGTAKRRRWGLLAVFGGLALIAPALAAASIGLLALFASLRKLVLEQIVNTWHGFRRAIDGVGSLLHAGGQELQHLGLDVRLGFSVPHQGDRIEAVDRFVNTGVRDWWAVVGVSVIIGVFWLAALGWVFIGAVLDRLRWIRGQDRLEGGVPGRPPGPVPITLAHVTYRYPGADRDALAGVSLRIGGPEMVAVVGDNGSGKSTLTRILAGRPPRSGSVERPGAPGLGRPGGTAVILQHPETQVLGVTVADDVVWGLDDGADVDVAGLLERVGLAGMEERETSGLSGGELQRLAVAAALGRRPALLLSDESTAMVDEDGRVRLTALLRDLPRREGIAVVHVTHRPEEAQQADRIFRMAAGRVASDAAADGAGAAVDGAGAAVDGVAADGAAADGAAAGTDGRRRRARLGIASVGPQRPEELRLTNVGHIYNVGTPWAKTALTDVELVVAPGDGLLVVGGNGSGKSTLAWVMAGLVRPTYGECRLGEEPVRQRVGSVALAFQHARLQLQRSTVSADIKAAGAPDDEAVAAVLEAVGLDPERFADRRVDELSGGEQRRAALAGLLSRRPSVLLLDEPMAGLDGPSRDGLVALLAALRRDHGLTVVVISHDMGGMERICDRMVRLDGGRLVSDSALSGVGW